MARSGPGPSTPTAHSQGSYASPNDDLKHAEPLLEARGVGKSFLKKQGKIIQETHALSDVNLSVRQGELCVIIGPSGCGKSTLLRLLHGLIEPSAGRIQLRGNKVEKPGPQIGMVFQQPALMKWRTALANVEFGLECLQLKTSERRERALRYIETVGLSGFERYYPHELSGGMQQRIGLARALAIEPELIFMDEPFGALDAQTRLLLQEEFQRIWMMEKRTAILVTHDMEEAVYLGDRVLCMSPRPGRIVEVIDVPLERPRRPEVRNEASFAAVKAELWRVLRASILDGPDE